MSVQLIRQYHAKVEKLIRYGGSRNESALRKTFQDLLEAYALGKNLLLVPEVELRTRGGRRVVPDGTLKDALRQDWGYWESKDEKDDLQAEIAVKFARGYPATNILFEDTHTAVLYQAGEEALRADFADVAALDALLTRFVSYEPREVTEFHRAIEQFNAEVPALAAELRAVIEEQYAASPAFRKALNEFLALCQKAINPHVEMADAREMIIQHVLTEDIFMTVFDDPQFHRENAIARMLQGVVDTFYYGATRHAIHDRIAPYYETINARAAQIYNHWEKQKFLKALYENFYRVYNPKAADRLGIIYTPDEIVRFMIASADHLAFQHFGKTLGDVGVEILDPATGTGTFITELIEYLPASQLPYKYQHEIHCNEVAILPYYIANLNIEYTYKQKTGEYLPFEAVCFVDTLDNLGFAAAGKRQMDFFAIVDENIERVQRQNERRISVIIGNPPYNANQLNENENNKNREYPEIDRRIKETYIRHSTAQKTKAYDMYVRFYRWASDRIDENGIVAFITNNSFLNRRNLDGFRQVVADEFSHIYIVDLGGNVRDNPKLSGTTHNVFGIQIGVAIALMVKKKSESGRCQIFYARRPEMERASEKLEFLRNTRFSDIPFQVIHPDKHHNWLDLAEHDWEELVPIASREAKLSKGQSEPQAIFKLFSLGTATNRDEWVYDEDRGNLERKVRLFCDVFNTERIRWKQSDGKLAIADFVDRTIKWTSELEDHLIRGAQLAYDDRYVTVSAYRPFVKAWFYYDRWIVHRLYQQPRIFPIAGGDGNLVICFTNPGSQKPFMTLASRDIPDLHLVGAASGTECLPLYCYTAAGERVDNITDWALAQFRARYGPHPQPLSQGERGASLPFSQGERGAHLPFSHREKGPGDEGESCAQLKPPLPPELLQRVRELRHNATDAERLLWQLLRNRQLTGCKFRRQHPVAGYVLDFYCYEAKLAVELDGGQHAEPEQVACDAERTRALEAEGLRVLRFWNNDVLRNTEAVLEAIWDTLTPADSPHPQPLSQGERGATLPLSQGDRGATLPLSQGDRGASLPFSRWEKGPGDEGKAGDEGDSRPITKLDVFHYVYAVLHHPAYRQKYERNLKREFPRIPFYDDFWQWAEWGRQLMDLHLNYEQTEPYPVAREDQDPQATRKAIVLRLIAHKETGVIEVDTLTTLRGVPPEAWDYRLGTYSALEWVLERHKERTPKDPTIRERFNTYRFTDYKERVIDLLRRVCTVSVETVKIVRQMPG